MNTTAITIDTRKKKIGAFIFTYIIFIFFGYCLGSYIRVTRALFSIQDVLEGIDPEIFKSEGVNLELMNTGHVSYLLLVASICGGLELLNFLVVEISANILFPPNPADVPVGKRVLRLLPALIGALGVLICTTLMLAMSPSIVKGNPIYYMMYGAQAGVLLVMLSWIIGYGKGGFMSFACLYEPAEYFSHLTPFPYKSQFNKV